MKSNFVPLTFVDQVLICANIKKATNGANVRVWTICKDN